MASVRDYAVLYLGGKVRSGASIVGGGNTVVATGVHALDGPEHTGQLPIERISTDELDTTLVVIPDGAGGLTFGGASGGSFVPTYLAPAEVFSIPDNRQALFALSVVLDVGAGISVGTNSALVEVH